MLTKSVADYHFKTSLQAVNLVQKTHISDKDGSVSVNPKLLFQSLTAILLSGKNNDNRINLSDLFSYSLCVYPASLAYSSSEMLVSAKSKLLEPFKETCSIKTNLTNDQQIGVVIDGVDLMYTMVNWEKQSYFIEIADKCVRFVIEKYLRSCTIAFDNYHSEPTTKITHIIIEQRKTELD